MTHAFNLTREDEDQLKELLNIGVSHASTTLSKMMGKSVTISVPNLGVKSARSLSVTVKDPNEITVAVLLRLSGILEGYVMLFFPYSASVRLLEALSGKKVTDLRALDRYDRSVFQEVGNVLTGGMLRGLSQFLHIELMQSVPDVVIDMGGAMFNSISAAMIDKHNEFLSLDVAICVDAEPGSITCKDGQEAVGSMYLFLGPEAADTILSLTGKMINPTHESR
jgi:chemotaxis protein CheC